MRIPSVSLQAATLRAMPAINPLARVEKRSATEALGKPRAVASSGRPGASSLKRRSGKGARRGAWDGLGQEVDVLV